MFTASAVVLEKHAFVDEDMLGPNEAGDSAVRAGGLV